MADRVGQQLGNYRITRLLGRGGFAEVYHGEHIYLKTPAAIKVLQMKVANQDDLESFLTEARTIAHLIHPHIVRVMDFGVDGDTPFLAMDYAPNGTLRQRHPKGTVLPLSTIVQYVKQIAEALQHAHDEKLIHRDIKPENILLGRRDEILLSDFGIALIAQSTRYQSTQDVVGTVAYMSPEQIHGKPRPASDQYSLGIVVYEWLCGDRPFHGSFTELCSQHMYASPPPLHDKVPTLPPAVELVVNIALAKDPKQRFGSIQAFANALEQASHLEKPPVVVAQPAMASPPASQAKTPANDGSRLQAKPITESPKEQHTATGEGAEKVSMWDADILQIISNALRARGGNTSEKMNVWGIGRRQIAATLLGIVFYAILSHFSVYITNSIILPTVLIPLFFGAVYGPWVGLFTGGVGFLLGEYISSFDYVHHNNYYYGGYQCNDPICYAFPYHYSAFHSVNWYWVLANVLIGFIAGLAFLSTKGHYNAIRSSLFADIVGTIGIAFSLGIISLGPESSFIHSLYWPTIIFCLIFFPILLFIYAKSPDGQHTIAEIHTQNRNIWGIGKRQVVVMITGITLYVILTSVGSSLLGSAWVISVPYYFAALVIIFVFIAASFGSWISFFSIGIGFLIEISTSKYLYHSPNWNYDIGVALIGFITGLALLLTKGRYRTIRNIAIADVLSAIGVAVGVGFIVDGNDPFLPNAGEIFIRLALPASIAVLLLLPILLLIYNAITNRARLPSPVHPAS